MKNIKLNLQQPLNGLEESIQSDNILIGMRVPKDYFITKGSGESDITIHAGSYHLALKKAGIERFNIMTYSSILPAIATEIPQPSAQIHGAVMETITAACNGSKGELLSAGIIYGWLYNRQTHEKYGGLVCEHEGKYSESELKENLHASLNELYYNGFEEDFYLKGKHLITESFVPQKKYGTALTAICFINHQIPIIKVGQMR